MIIVKIIGGLGNQMFQLATGIALAKRNKTTCKIDITNYKNYTLHKYSLDHFNYEPVIASESEIHNFRKQQGLWFMNTLFSQLLKYAHVNTVPRYIEEKNYTFSPEVFMDRRSDLYLDGYWQSEKYFQDIANEIRQGFRVRDEPTGLNKEYLDRIKSTESICIHIRRGDYITNKETQTFHGATSLTYYYKALEYISKHVSSFQLYIFSDDPTWVKGNFQTQFPTTYVTHNGSEKNFEDLRLMYSCKHHIIANSTFSWWSVWLAQSNNQIVIAPKHWFRAEVNTNDLIPPNWIRM